MLFKTDDTEMTTTAGNPFTDESTGVPGGIIGFSLDFWMVPCAGGMG